MLLIYYNTSCTRCWYITISIVRALLWEEDNKFLEWYPFLFSSTCCSCMSVIITTIITPLYKCHLILYSSWPICYSSPSLRRRACRCKIYRGILHHLRSFGGTSLSCVSLSFMYEISLISWLFMVVSLDCCILGFVFLPVISSWLYFSINLRVRYPFDAWISTLSSCCEGREGI